MSLSGRWTDAPCYTALPYVCEKPSDGATLPPYITPVPTLPSDSGCENGWYGYGSSCFLVSGESTDGVIEACFISRDVFKRHGIYPGIYLLRHVISRDVFVEACVTSRDVFIEACVLSRDVFIETWDISGDVLLRHVIYPGMYLLEHVIFVRVWWPIG